MLTLINSGFSHALLSTPTPSWWPSIIDNFVYQYLKLQYFKNNINNWLIKSLSKKKIEAIRNEQIKMSLNYTIISL